MSVSCRSLSIRQTDPPAPDAAPKQVLSMSGIVDLNNGKRLFAERPQQGCDPTDEGAVSGSFSQLPQLDRAARIESLKASQKTNGRDREI